jgi:hypothetical protein
LSRLGPHYSSKEKNAFSKRKKILYGGLRIPRYFNKPEKKRKKKKYWP